MRLLEYQDKKLLAGAGISVPEGQAVDDASSAEQVARRLAGPVVVKAQIQSGGRGRAGGVLVAETPADASRAAQRLLGSQVAGLIVHRVLVERRLDLARELYLGVVLDFDVRRPVLLLGSCGGVEIEALAQADPGSLCQTPVDPLVGLPDYIGRDMLRRCGLEPELFPKLWPLARRLYQLFLGHDALLAEINPLVLTGTGELVAADARLNVDDAALGRQPEVARLAG